MIEIISSKSSSPTKNNLGLLERYFSKKLPNAFYVSSKFFEIVSNFYKNYGSSRTENIIGFYTTFNIIYKKFSFAYYNLSAT